ncbi:hypothetical protein EYC80_002106 [Monilinia laxa]|uniref:GEgh 16 protein n=1 Tax=Monilinia laxa TaxID=61186 RepID=A0A5N6K2U0_MONLA|nr:hypothetical protein EYC80_002106 [Monilinia laxa]
MRYSIAVAAIIPFVAAHGKIAVMTGDMGGNTTGLGIQGAVIPGAGTNKQTEVDTTVFNSKNAATDGLGKTKAGPNTMADMKAVMAQSGDTLPQVSDGGDLSGTIHIVTTDGAGPYSAIVDPTGTGAFSQGTQAKVTTQVPGTRGNIAAPKQRSLMMRSLVKMGIVKRAKNVNEDYPIKIQMPAGMSCTGTVAGQSGVCMVKIANPSGAGPFGGVAVFQMAGAAGASTASTGAGNGTAAATEATTEKRNRPSNIGAFEGSIGLEGKVVNSFKTGALDGGRDGEHKRSNGVNAGAFEGDAAKRSNGVNAGAFEGGVGLEGKLQAGAFEGDGAKRSIGAKFRA